MEKVFDNLSKTINEVGKKLSKVNGNLKAKNLRHIVRDAIKNSLNYGHQGELDEAGWSHSWD